MSSLLSPREREISVASYVSNPTNLESFTCATFRPLFSPLKYPSSPPPPSSPLQIHPPHHLHSAKPIHAAHRPRLKPPHGRSREAPFEIERLVELEHGREHEHDFAFAFGHLPIPIFRTMAGALLAVVVVVPCRRWG